MTARVLCIEILRNYSKFSTASFAETPPRGTSKRGGAGAYFGGMIGSSKYDSLSPPEYTLLSAP
jgi:hypothetical protein